LTAAPIINKPPNISASRSKYCKCDEISLELIFKDHVAVAAPDKYSYNPRAIMPLKLKDIIAPVVAAAAAGVLQ